MSTNRLENPLLITVAVRLFPPPTASKLRKTQSDVCNITYSKAGTVHNATHMHIQTLRFVVFNYSPTE